VLKRIKEAQASLTPLPFFFLYLFIGPYSFLAHINEKNQPQSFFLLDERNLSVTAAMEVYFLSPFPINSVDVSTHHQHGNYSIFNG
jgi:hypothetical protein